MPKVNLNNPSLRVWGAFFALLLALSCLGLFPRPASATPSNESSEVVGNLTIMVTFNPEVDGVADGHSYLLFTSYVDGLELKFEDLYGYYTIDRDFLEAAQKDEQLWSYKSGGDADEVFTLTKGELYPADIYNRFRCVSYDCTLNAGEFVTIGNYTMVAPELGVDDNRELVRMINDSIRQSDLSDNFFAGTRGYWGIGITQGFFLADFFSSLTRFCWEQNPFEGDIPGKLLSLLRNALGLSHAKSYSYYQGIARLVDGDTTGGLFVNREMWRQKSWQDMYPNTGYSVDITQEQLDDLLDYLNHDQNHYALVAHNCAFVCTGAWNAALGFEKDAKGKNTTQHTPLYIDAKDTTFDPLSGLFETPKKLYEVISQWGPERGGTLVELPVLHGVEVPE